MCYLLCSNVDKPAAFEQRQLEQQPNRTAAEQADQQPPEQQRSGLLRRTFSGWRVYLQQPVLPAAFALALLYLTVMSLGK
jgi:Ferroportin1 (FPN1)